MTNSFEHSCAPRLGGTSVLIAKHRRRDTEGSVECPSEMAMPGVAKLQSDREQIGSGIYQESERAPKPKLASILM